MTPTLESKWHLLCDRWERLGYEALSDDERVWCNLRGLIDAVENGGLISYFYNSGADRLRDCRTALRRLNALDVLARVDDVATLFGSEVPATVDQRNRIIDSWPEDDATRDALLEKVDHELMPLVSHLEFTLVSFLTECGLAPRA
jgi:hypothetical protein